MAVKIDKYLCDICGQMYDSSERAVACENVHAKIQNYKPFYNRGNIEERTYPPYIDVQFLGDEEGLPATTIRYIQTK